MESVRDFVVEERSEIVNIAVRHVNTTFQKIKDEMLNKIYRNPMKWWMQEEIQIAKDRFCEKYAYVSDNWLEEWKAELLNIDPEHYGEGKFRN